MLVLITYDVSTIDSNGKKRLRHLAKKCQNHGQRVQNSVFEANLDYSSFLKLKNDILKIIDLNQDSVRFYYLGNKWFDKVEHFGIKESYNPEGTLII